MTTRDAPASSAARPASITCWKFEPSSSPSRARTATSGLGRSVVMSIVGLPGLRGPYELRQGRLVPAPWQDTVVHGVRQRPGKVDAHAAERPLVERQVEARLGNAPGIEWRRRVPDPDLDPV